MMILSAVFLSGCGGDDSGDQVDLAGVFGSRVEGTVEYVGLASRGDGFAVAYVCDGAQVSRWLLGRINGDGTLDFPPSADVALRGSLDSRIKGTVTIEGQSHPFQADRLPGSAGLYSAAELVDGLEYRGGWILLDDGSQRGAVRSDGSIIANPSLTPSIMTVQLSSGIRLNVSSIDSTFLNSVLLKIVLPPRVSSVTSQCAAIAADGLLTQSELALWTQLNCANFYSTVLP